MRKKLTLILIAIAAMVAVACGGDATPTPEPQGRAYTPVFEPTECWFQLAETQPVDCGYLVVPEDRNNPSSPDIKLAVAILRHPGGNPEPDPIIRLHGGPGGGYLRFMEVAFQDDATLFPANRDVIAFDQRGVGLSQPELGCPELGKGMVSIQSYVLDGAHVTEAGYRSHLAELAEECAAELSKVADLSAYNTETSAADVNDLRIAFGYDTINIHAGSYGTRLARYLMRIHPENIRSIILDAPSTSGPVQTAVGGVVKAMDETFEGCSLDPACNEAFPDLRGSWLETMERLEEEPETIPVFHDLTGEPFDLEINPSTLGFAMRLMDQSTGSLGAIPIAIDQAHKGEYGAIGKVWEGIAARLDGFSSTGAAMSMNCSDAAQTNSRDALYEAIALAPEWERYYAASPFDGDTRLEICERWDVRPLQFDHSQPLTSDIPTLLLVGEFDAAVNFDNAHAIAANLENSYGMYVFPGMGHIVALGNHPCPARMATDFFINPNVEPDSSCIIQMSGPDYVVELGVGTDIELVAYASEMFQGVVPEGWNEVGPGFFARSNPSVDKTLLVQAAAPKEFADEMIGEVLGEFGITGLPDPLRTIVTDQLTWKMHLPAGVVPIIIATAETEDAAYLLALIATRGEFDELVDTVLIPVINALTPGGVAGAPSAGFSIDPDSSFQEQMQAILDQAVPMGTPGAAMYVETDEGQVWVGAAGVSNLETGDALAADDKFWIYSSSKTFVATVVMQLVEEGTLSLDSSIGDWLEPSLFASVPNGESVTIRMLLNHTSGIYDFVQAEEVRD